MTSNEGGSCTETCIAKNKNCKEEYFEYINKCSVLMRHFKCNKCQGGVIGEDIPNYVSGNKPEFKDYCLTTDINPKCNAKHHTSQRLCPCV